MRSRAGVLRGVVRRQGLEDDLRGRAGHLEHSLSQLEHGELVDIYLQRHETGERPATITPVDARRAIGYGQ